MCLCFFLWGFVGHPFTADQYHLTFPLYRFAAALSCMILGIQLWINTPCLCLTQVSPGGCIYFLHFVISERINFWVDDWINKLVTEWMFRLYCDKYTYRSYRLQWYYGFCPLGCSSQQCDPTLYGRISCPWVSPRWYHCSSLPLPQRSMKKQDLRGLHAGH